MILTASDFDQRPYKVPNQEESGDFGYFIEVEEERLGKELLGVDLFDLFSDALNSSGSLPERFEKLRDGASYQVNDVTTEYGGWVDLIRPAIYSLWQPQGTWKFTNIGWVENNAPQQSKLIEDQYPFHVQYWNEYCKKVGIAADSCYNYMNSFYGFMRANASDYPEWVFIAPQFKNRFDI